MDTNSNHNFHHVWHASEYHCHSSAQKSAASELLNKIRFNGNEKVLDIGCGDGKITAAIADRLPLGIVLGLDVSREMIAFANAKYSKDQYPNLSFIQQDAQNLALPGQFDLIFSSFALQWVLDHDDFLKRAFQILKPSGVFVATIPLGVSSALELSIARNLAKPEWVPYFQNFIQKWQFTSEAKFTQSLRANDFTIHFSSEVIQEALFANREEFEKYVLQWFPYLHYLPENLKKPFFQEVIDGYFAIETTKENGAVPFRFPRLDIIASKALSSE